MGGGGDLALTPGGGGRRQNVVTQAWRFPASHNAPQKARAQASNTPIT